MTICILGILKAGGAYLPLDPGYPTHRILSSLTEGNINILLTTAATFANHRYTELLGLGRGEIDVQVTPSRPPLVDLDALPIPDRSLVDYQSYSNHIGHAPVKNSIALQATRGCPYRCAYCHRIWSKGHHIRSARHIFEEVQLYYNMGIRRFVFIDDVFNLNEANSRRFFELVITHRLDIEIYFPNGIRGDILSGDYIDLMVEGGTTGVALALETASPRLQKAIGKNLDLEKLRQALEYFCQKYPGVILELFTMHGFPTETQEEALMTLDFVKNLEWIHFPYVLILKIYPNTPMEAFALKNGISAKAIYNSSNFGYHELPETLPFASGFTLTYQADFMNRYFLAKERLLHVLPHQMKVLTQDELVQKYNSFLPVKIACPEDLLRLVGIESRELETPGCREEASTLLPDLNRKMQDHFGRRMEKPCHHSLRILLLDLSRFFSSDSTSIYDVIVPPLGLMYVLTFLQHRFGSQIKGKIASSRVDFDSYGQLKTLVEEFKPDVIGIRTLSFYKDFFHKTAAFIRDWGIQVPIITGGPYASSDYKNLLKDTNIQLAVLGEGEITFTELIAGMLENNGRLPPAEVLTGIKGLAFVPHRNPAARGAAREILTREGLEQRMEREPATNPGPLSQPGDPVYAIFTSGSTGKPKGASVYQRSFVNLLNWFVKGFSLTRTDRVLLLTSFSFDLTQKNIYAPLMVGGTLHISPLSRYDPQVVRQEIVMHRITWINCTPSMAYALCDFCGEKDWEKLSSLRYLFLGGEPIALVRLKRWIQSGYCQAEIVNTYGPTECTDICAYYRLKPSGKDVEAPVPIGRPIDNVRLFVLDQDLRPVPIEVAGELFIAGTGVGAGYIDNPGLTAEKFLTPSLPGGRKKRLYRTGDQVKWLPDGNIEFLGRNDHQVKIRGYRIELGEIENQLMNHSDIKEAVVTAAAEADETSDKCLYAYIVSAKELTGTELREFLAKELPAYMIPASFIRLDNIPLTPNGKVNRNALPNPGVKAEDAYAAPLGEVEARLVDFWSEVLGIEKRMIGRNSNFFYLGGHSLKATALVSRVHRALQTKIPLSVIFNAPTLKGMAQHVKQAQENRYASVEAAEKKEYYPLSAAQKRLYILQQLELNSKAYNVPQVVTLEGDVEMERLGQTFKKLTARHDSLRTSFEMTGAHPVQKIHESLDFKIAYSEAEEEANTVQSIINNFFKPFDLSRVPLLRVGVIKLSARKTVLIMDLHHIITDGFSQDILTRELIPLHHGRELPPLKLQYKDYSEWQYGVKQQESLKRQESYWLAIYQDAIPVLTLAHDHIRPRVQDSQGGDIAFVVTGEQLKGLKTLASEQEVTLYMVLLALYYVLLTKVSGQEDIVVGTPVSGRNHSDLEPIVGIFVNTLALRNYTLPARTFTQFLGEIKVRTLEAFDNQDYPFEELVDKLKIERNSGRNPLFDVMFTFETQNRDFEGILADINLNIKPSGYENRTSKFDMILSAVEEEHDLHFNIEYSTTLFKKETIERFAAYFKDIVTAVLQNSNVKLKDIEISLDLVDSKSTISLEAQGDFGF